MADTEDDRERFLARFNDNCIGIRGFLEGWWFGFSFRYEGREYSFSASPGRLYSGEKNLFTLYRIKGSLENEETDGQAAEPVCDMTKSSSDGSVISSFRNFLQRLLRGSPDWSSDSASDCRDRTSISQDGKTFILLAKANYTADMLNCTVIGGRPLRDILRDRKTEIFGEWQCMS